MKQATCPNMGSANSYWAASASLPSVLPELQGQHRTEVAIIGGGYTGLSTAWHLANADISTIVLEGKEPGWGASGRNGGMLAPRYKKGFAALAVKYGNETTRRLYTLIHEAIDTVEVLVEEGGIDCLFARTGQLTAAHSADHLNSLAADCAWMQAEAGDRAARLLDRHEVAAEIGGGAHAGGWLDPRGAGLHPLRYAQGLASALVMRGVPTFARTPVTRLTEDSDCVRLETPEGSVVAKQVVIATNAYTDTTDLTPGNLSRRIVPVSSSAIATTPIGDNLAATVLPRRRMVADTKHLLNWYRVMPDRRVVFGGRGDITGRSDAPRTYKRLERQLAETFPQLADTAITHRWSGRVAITQDNFPHIGRLSSRVSFALGYGGRGVALATLLGRELAKMVQGLPVEAGPMSDADFSPVPLHGFRVPGMLIVASWYRFRDAQAARQERARVSGREVKP